MAWASPVAQMVKNPPAIQEIQVRFLGWEDPLEEGMAIHSSVLAMPVDKAYTHTYMDTRLKSHR